MQGLGRLKKSPPTISILGLALPISDSQPLCISHHSIHPSKVWSSHSPQTIKKKLRVEDRCTFIIIIIIIIIIMFLKYWASFLLLDPQVEVGPSISSSVILCSFVLFCLYCSAWSVYSFEDFSNVLMSLDRLPARRRVSLEVGLPPRCLSTCMLFCMGVLP